jgi:hypothetical protein
VKQLVLPVCSHRITVNPRAALPRGTNAGDAILTEILTLVEVPL